MIYASNVLGYHNEAEKSSNCWGVQKEGDSGNLGFWGSDRCQ